MKWVLLIVGSAGLLTGLGCSSWQNTQPYAAYPQYQQVPQGYAQPATAAPTLAPGYYAPTAAPVAQPTVAVGPPPVAMAPPTTMPLAQSAMPMAQPVVYQQGQPVVYQQAQQACVPCVPCQ